MTARIGECLFCSPRKGKTLKQHTPGMVRLDGVPKKKRDRATKPLPACLIWSWRSLEDAKAEHIVTINIAGKSALSDPWSSCPGGEQACGGNC